MLHHYFDVLSELLEEVLMGPYMFYRKQAEIIKLDPDFTQRGKRRKNNRTEIRKPLEEKVDPHRRAPFADLLSPHQEKQGRHFSQMYSGLNPKTPEFIDTEESSSDSEAETSNDQAKKSLHPISPEFVNTHRSDYDSVSSMPKSRSKSKRRKISRKRHSCKQAQKSRTRLQKPAKSDSESSDRE